MTRPMMKAPVMLAANVGHGNPLVVVGTRRLSSNRPSVPAAPPRAMTAIVPGCSIARRPGADESVERGRSESIGS